MVDPIALANMTDYSCLEKSRPLIPKKTYLWGYPLVNVYYGKIHHF